MPALRQFFAATTPTQIFAATTNGVYSISLHTGEFAHIGLDNSVVGHLAYRNGQLLATCPVLSHVHKMQDIDPQQHGRHVPGAHIFDLASPSEKPTCVWQGDARSCAIGPSAQANSSQYYVGTEPADVVTSSDGGQSWASINALAECHSSQEWYFPAPPYKPHVLSIDFAASDDLQPLIIAGVEVGGVVVSRDRGRSWEESSCGICLDVHSVRPDPFDRRRLYAVTGGGNLPGGVYYSSKSGRSWRRIFGYRYSLGLALNPYRKAELLLTAADKAPCIGSYVFHSADGGRNWTNVTDNVFSQFEDKQAMKFTPVPLFVPGGVVLGTCTGHLLFSEKPDSNDWRVVCQLPARVNALTRDDNLAQSSSVMH